MAPGNRTFNGFYPEKLRQLNHRGLYNIDIFAEIDEYNFKTTYYISQPYFRRLRGYTPQSG